MWVDRQTGYRASQWGEEREKRDKKPEAAPMSLPLSQELARGRMFLHSASGMLCSALLAQPHGFLCPP